MNRPFLTRISALVLAAGLAGLARPAVADPRPSLRIALHVYDDESIPPDVVSRAKAEMTRIYRHAGIDVVWTKQASSVVTLSILSREITDDLIVAETALGATPSTREYRGLLAYVFYNRVERVARTYLNTARRRGTYDIDNVIVLGHAMAHEVGHLLLPYGHSATGLMRAEWSGGDLRRAVRGQLNFTPEQAASIRAKLMSQPGSESATTIRSESMRTRPAARNGLSGSPPRLKRQTRGSPIEVG